MRVIFDNATDGIIVLQGDRVVEVNKRGVELFGYPRNEIIAKPFLFFVHLADRSLVEANYKNRLKGIGVPSYDFRLMHKKGGYSWVRINASVINWCGAKAVLVFIRDITDLKNREQELHKSA
ncbi:MAG TPA: PAS domain S-box protein, partial [Candidatus Nanoarchaeia archaeon]|nr:PAS domain S-box protein [Candidatus Nanoarchaeia archaeon]